MELRLDGQVALVTGASRGIGRAIATAFAEAGAKVMLSSRKQEGLEKAAAEIDGEVDVFAANAGVPEQAEACVAATVERFGGLDILVNNAGTNPFWGPAMEIDLPRYDKTFEVNVRGPLVWTQLAWRAAMAERGGCVINVASIGGLGTPGLVPVYGTTKAALIHLTKALALELAPGVRVTALAPGIVKTDMAGALVEAGGSELTSRFPLGRLGEPEDIAAAALFLASPAASWITGEVLVVDGGQLLKGLG
ncbi:MAG TPA: SDR family oxidoreductase [Acidimicrobiia bacterium]|nr:SDR family oxidoreductase [Acidimicrobiia bacterium]